MLSLLPNEHWDYSAADLLSALPTALSSRRLGAQPDIDLPGLGRCLAIRSGRAGIVTALKALHLPRQASIGVPLYCCPVVLKAIGAAGFRPRFVDVDPGSYCLSAADLAAKSSELDAVIAVHMFGNICDMPGLREAARGKIFIEDCAQALGSSLNTRPAGSFGQIAVFSFRSGKYLSVGEGGAIYCDGDTGLERRTTELIAGLSIPTRVEECVHIVKTYLRSRLRTRPLWGLLGARLWNAYNRNVSLALGSPVVPGQVYQTDRKLAVKRLTHLGRCIEIQRSNAGYYSRNLMVDAGMLCSEPPGAFYNRLQYPLLFPTSDQCEGMAARLRENQIGTARPYKDIAAIATAHYGYTGDCPRAESVARRVLVIPCNHSIRAADRERIVSCVNRAWAEIGGCRPNRGGRSMGKSGTKTADRAAAERTA